MTRQGGQVKDKSNTNTLGSRSSVSVQPASAARGDSAAPGIRRIDMTTEEESLQCAGKVLAVYTKRGFEPRTALMLTLKDLMIYAAANGLDFTKELKMARLTL